MLEIGARSDAIIADSDASRNDIIKYLRIRDTEQDKVKRIYCGVSDKFRSTPTGQSADARNGDNRETKRILYVGRADPYKNLVGMITAFAQARKQARFPLHLTIVGPKDERYPEARQQVASLGLGDSVSWSGYLSQDQLIDLYRNVDLLVHPSRYEGFGLQVAEAMASGTPVVCSNGGSLPEVAGNAAIILDPDDTVGFTKGILDVLSNPSLARTLVEKGFEQSAKFTWRTTAEETLAVYRSLV